MANLVKPRFNPSFGFSLVSSVLCTPQCPQVLPSVIKIQKFLGLGPTLVFQIPNPVGPISQHQRLLGSAQPPSLSFPMQSLAKFHGLTLPAHYCFIENQPSPRLRPSGLLLL